MQQKLQWLPDFSAEGKEVRRSWSKLELFAFGKKIAALGLQGCCE